MSSIRPWRELSHHLHDGEESLFLFYHLLGTRLSGDKSLSGGRQETSTKAYGVAAPTPVSPYTQIIVLPTRQGLGGYSYWGY